MIAEGTRVLYQPEGYLPVEKSAGKVVLWDGEKVDNAFVVSKGEQKAIKVTMFNGMTFTCSPEQEIKTMLKLIDGTSWTKAKDLESRHLIYLNQDTFEFDDIDLSPYKYLCKLNSEEVGALASLFRNLTVTPGVLDLPKSRKGCRKEISRLLSLCCLDVKIEEYYKRAERIRFTVNNKDFLEEITPFIFSDKFTEHFWKSKPFMRGVLRVLFTFSGITKAMITLRAPRESVFLKEVQEALTLFGINSGYTRGINFSNLILSNNNCYRFAHRIGVFNPEMLFLTIDFKKIIGYKDITMSDMRYGTIHRIEEVDSVPMFEVDSKGFIFSGVIAR